MTDRPFPRRHRLPHEAYDNRDATFHFTVDAFPDTRPFADGPLGDMVWRTLLRERELSSVVLVAACLMPDHLHLVIRPWESNAEDWVGEFKSLTTRRAWKRTGRATLWQPSSWDLRLYGRRVGVVVAYVLRNPIAAGLVDDIDEWPWVRAWTE